VDPDAVWVVSVVGRGMGALDGVVIVEAVLGVNVGHPTVTNGIFYVRGGDAALPKLLWDFLYRLTLSDWSRLAMLGALQHTIKRVMTVIIVCNTFISVRDKLPPTVVCCCWTRSRDVVGTATP